MKKVTVSWGFYICAACMVLLLPIRWVIGFYLAAFIHESFHILAAAAFSIRVRRVELRSTGMYLEISPGSQMSEFVCSLAGPFGGLLAAKYCVRFPEMAICAFFQSFVNLVPIYPLDGGRMLRCVLDNLFSDKMAAKIERVIVWMFMIAMSAGVVYACFYLDLGVLSVIAWGVPLGKWMKNTLQTRERGGTIYLPIK